MKDTKVSKELHEQITPELADVEALYQGENEKPSNTNTIAIHGLLELLMFVHLGEKVLRHCRECLGGFSEHVFSIEAQSRLAKVVVVKRLLCVKFFQSNLKHLRRSCLNSESCSYCFFTSL